MYFALYQTRESLINDYRGRVLGTQFDNVEPYKFKTDQEIIYPIEFVYYHPPEKILEGNVVAKSKTNDLIIRDEEIAVYLFDRKSVIRINPECFCHYFAKTYKYSDEMKGYYTISKAVFRYHVEDEDLQKKYNVHFNDATLEVTKEKLYYLSSKLIIEQMKNSEDIHLNISSMQYLDMIQLQNYEGNLIYDYIEVLDYLESYLLKLCFKKKFPRYRL